MTIKYLINWENSVNYGQVGVNYDKNVEWNRPLVQWLWEEIRVRKIMSSNPSKIQKILIFCCKHFNKRQKNEKEAGSGNFFRHFE